MLSFSWAEAVDLVPASQRPYVGSSTANSEVQLALGYNGLDRLVGFAGFGNRTAGAADPLNAIARGFTAGETGAPGPLRLLSTAPGWSTWLAPLPAALSLVCASALVMARLASQSHLSARLRRLSATVTSTWKGHAGQTTGTRLAFPAVIAAIGMGALLLAPTAWSLASLQHSSGLLPIAGPPRQNDLFAGLMNNRAQVDPKLIGYLEAHRDNARFLVATLNALQAAPIILEADQPVMTLGGFLGRDPILTPDGLAKRVEHSACSVTNTNTVLNWLDAHNSGYLAWTWDTWGTSCGDLSLILDYSGTPKSPNGTNFKSHLASVTG